MDFNGHNDFGNFGGNSELSIDRAELECEELFVQADKMLNDGIVREAVEKLSQILKRNPRFGKAYNHLGWVYETKYKNMARAEEYYKAAMQYAPTYNAAFLNYSYFLSNQGRFGELADHLDLLTRLPGVAKDTIANEYAIMYEMQGNIKEAMDHYRKAAIVTLDSVKLDKYKENIDRCKKKLDILDSTDIFDEMAN